MKKTARIAARYYGFLKMEEHTVHQIDGPQEQPPVRKLAQACDYPLFKLDRVSSNVVRRRAIVRGV